MTDIILPEKIMYDTTQFNNPDYWKDGKQPFVYSFGDP